MDDKKSILVVDDDDSILKFIKTILEKEKYAITIVQTGKEAIEICKKHKFDGWNV